MKRTLITALVALPLSFACEAARPNSSVASREAPPSPEPRFVAPAFIEHTAPSTQSAQTSTTTASTPPAPLAEQPAPPAPPQAAPTTDATTAANSPDVTLFYDSLAPYGEWTELAPYGWVWIPRDVPVGWQPYTTGRWVYADQAGWVWVGDEPWAWAPYTHPTGL